MNSQLIGVGFGRGALAQLTRSIEKSVKLGSIFCIEGRLYLGYVVGDRRVCLGLINAFLDGFDEAKNRR